MGRVQTVLIVDDDAPTIDTLHSVLTEEGYAVQTASHGAQALALLQAVPIALILTDVMMPEIDGLALCQAVQADPATQAIPIVLMSAGRRRVDTDGCVFAGFLHKPFSLVELLDLVVRLIGPADMP